MAAKKFIPRQWQEPCVEFLQVNQRGMLWAPMGSGKTSSVLTAAVEMHDWAETVFPMLVVAPLRVAQSVWPTEAAEWEHTCHLRSSAIVGTAKERAAALNAKADIYTINFENLPWLLEALGWKLDGGSWKGSKWPFASIVVDEASKLKGFRTRQGTKRAKALAAVAWKSKICWLLTGTPATNGLQDVWGPAYFVDRGLRLGGSFTQFTERFFSMERVGKSAFATKPKANPGSQASVEKLLADVVLSIRLEDYLKLDEAHTAIINYDLPADARIHYEAMADEFFTQIMNDEIEAQNQAAVSQKLLQCSSGFMYDAEKKPVLVHDALIPALESVVEEWPGENLLVCYQYPVTAKRLMAAFPGARMLDKNPQTIKDWNDGKIKMMLMHPASAGHGLSLQHGGRIMVFAEDGWNLENSLQAKERMGPARQMQSGYKRTVYYYHLMARNTIQEQVYQRNVEKISVQDALLLAMSSRLGF